MTLTQEEYEHLKAIKVLYPWAKWVARNKNQHYLLVYSKKPKRESNFFIVYDGEGTHITCEYCDILSSLTWKSEPLNIDEALEGRGCEFCRALKSLISSDSAMDSMLKEVYIELDGSMTVDFWSGEESNSENVKINFCPNCGRRLEESD